MSSKIHEATLVERSEIAASIDRFVFRSSDGPFTFRAGQFVSLRVGEDSDGAAILRSYSIASSPTLAQAEPPRFELVVKRIPGGAASGFLGSLAIGATVRVTGPMGFFVLELSHPGDVVFAATGVGIAPVLPMIEEVLARAETGRVHLFWGSRNANELFWKDELARLATHPRMSVRVFLSGAGEARAPIEAGRITTPLLALAPSLVAPTFYLVGSGAMIREVKTALVAAGMDRKRQIRNEAFFD